MVLLQQAQVLFPAPILDGFRSITPDPVALTTLATRRLLHLDARAQKSIKYFKS